jgi:hypothetical protein
MQASRFAQLEQTQTSIAKKVLRAVPKLEPWHKRAIVAEVARAGSSADVKVIEGCLRHLSEVGLIRETSRWHYQQTPIKEPVPVETKSPIDDAISQPKVDPLDSFSSIASDLRKSARIFDSLASRIESTALAMAERITDAEKKSDDFKRLQFLLRDLAK